jgi:hypothetical protein
MDGQIFIGTKGADNTWTMEIATTNMAGKNPYMLAFAQDADGEVYALTSITTGPIDSNLDTIYKIVPAAAGTGAMDSTQPAAAGATDAAQPADAAAEEQNPEAAAGEEQEGQESTEPAQPQ